MKQIFNAVLKWEIASIKWLFSIYTYFHIVTSKLHNFFFKNFQAHFIKLQYSLICSIVFFYVAHKIARSPWYLNIFISETRLSDIGVCVCVFLFLMNYYNSSHTCHLQVLFILNHKSCYKSHKIQVVKQKEVVNFTNWVLGLQINIFYYIFLLLFNVWSHEYLCLVTKKKNIYLDSLEKSIKNKWKVFPPLWDVFFLKMST